MLHFIPWKKLKYKLHLFPQILGNKSGVELMCRTCQSRIKKKSFVYSGNTLSYPKLVYRHST